MISINVFLNQRGQETQAQARFSQARKSEEIKEIKTTIASTGNRKPQRLFE